MKKIPLSLYIHVPWCVRKCPYCDFNSHAKQGALPEIDYVDRLLTEVHTQAPHLENRSIHSIFIGGGTPSLFSPNAYEKLFNGLYAFLSFEHEIEITLEANPGTVEQKRFYAYRQLGINRLSLGIQSFNHEKLKRLGRIHDGEQALRAIDSAKTSGFTNFNLDLMFGLPNQTLDEAMLDIKKATDCKPTHLSWYQLTIEPNTYFYKKPPTLPEDDYLFEIQSQGQQWLTENNFIQYEISAYSQPTFNCQHNLNYWEFGDYLGIGAGAHSKLTDLKAGQITRHWNEKNPKNYLDPQKSFIENKKQLNAEELPLEFMMNALRLKKPIPKKLFTARTGLPIKQLNPGMKKAVTDGWIHEQNDSWQVTDFGYRFLNDLLETWVQ